MSKLLDASYADCRTCGAVAGVCCISPSGVKVKYHSSRRRLFERTMADVRAYLEGQQGDARDRGRRPGEAMRAEYWRDLVRRWVLVEEGIGSPDFLKLERAGLLREAVAALTGDGVNARATSRSGTCVCGHDAGRHADINCGRPGDCACDHFEEAAGPAPRLNKSGGSDVGVPWPLCAHPEGCLVRVDVEGARCRQHGGSGRW